MSKIDYTSLLPFSAVDNFVHGFCRSWREHFTVYVSRQNGTAPVKIPSPLWGYYADPFLLNHEGQDWLLVERMRYRLNRGDLCAIPLNGDLRAGGAIPMLSMSKHASFPWPLRIGSQLCLLPETSVNRCLDLYVCEAFPDRWTHASRLLENVTVIDSLLFQRDGLWWILTAQIEANESPQPFLALYMSDDPFSNKWQHHPINHQRRYQSLSHASMRNGGGLLTHKNHLIRPVQRNTHYYGQSLEFMRIDQLTPERYAESPIPAHDLFGPLSAHVCVGHHVSTTPNLIAFDQRTVHP